MRTIAILMSTYNGERYLREQIDSILSQSYKEWILYIRDDGSSDSTLNIIESYTTRYSNIILLHSNSVKLGPAKSFLYLLKEVDAPFYMFCDQDDVWLPNKIQVCINEMLSIEQSQRVEIPILIHTDLHVVDQSLNLLQRSFWKIPFEDSFVLKYMPVRNFVTGCTMFFNRRARELSLSDSEDIIMHDYWVSICVWAEGGIVRSINLPTIKYRQHGNNVLGAYNFQGNVIQRVLRTYRHNRSLLKMINLKVSFSLWRLMYLKTQYTIKRKELLKNV